MLAIVSDVHANHEALTAVLADAARQGARRVYCLGDSVNYGPDPASVLETIAERCKIVLRGNHEDALLSGSLRLNHVAVRALAWTREAIEANGRTGLWRFIEGLSPEAWDGDILFVHASPRDPLHEYLYGTEAMAARRGDPRAQAILAAAFAPVRALAFCGHTHRPGVITPDGRWFPARTLPDGYAVGTGRAIVNVGSVGQPRDRDRRAAYVTYDGQRVRFHRVVYDFRATARKILATDGLDGRLARRLKEGV